MADRPPPVLGGPNDVIVLLTLKDLLAQFKGKIGRDKLLQHMAKFPRWEDGPTHLRNGRKYLFRPADIRRLLASLESPQERHRSFYPGTAMPSAEADLKRARALCALPDPKAKTRKRNGTAKGKGAVAMMPKDR